MKILKNTMGVTQPHLNQWDFITNNSIFDCTGLSITWHECLNNFVANTKSQQTLKELMSGLTDWNWNHLAILIKYKDNGARFIEINKNRLGAHVLWSSDTSLCEDHQFQKFAHVCERTTTSSKLKLFNIFICGIYAC